MPEKSLTIFEDKAVRRVLCDGEWYFAVVDVVAALTGSRNPGDSWPCLKARELATCGVDLSDLCRWLEMDSVTSGPRHTVETATLEGIFRIVQAISSPRAEVFKRWLARAGEERRARQEVKTSFDSILSMLGEAATVEIACRQSADDENAACKARRIAEEARKSLTGEAGKSQEQTFFKKTLRCQMGTLNEKNLRFHSDISNDDDSLRSQIVTLETGRGKYQKFLSYVFTEQGVSMLSAVLHSDTAIKVSIQIINAFVEMLGKLENCRR